MNDNNKKLIASVPSKYRDRYVEIVALIDRFCDRQLNDEYKVVGRKMVACFCQEGSPVLRGKADSWACGLMYAVGRVNFLTDPHQSPHLTAERNRRWFRRVTRNHAQQRTGRSRTGST